MITVQILFWHDIPVQVRAGGRRDRVSVELPQRFQIAVDQAAMAAGLVGTDAYLDGFEWREVQGRNGVAADVVAAMVDEIEAAYPTIDWRRTAVRIRDAVDNTL